MSYSPYALLLFLAAMAMALVAHYAWHHRTAHPAAPPFVALVLSVTVWLAAYGFEILATGLALKEVWETVIIVAAAWLPFFWLVFAIQYTGQEAWLTGRNVALLLLPPIATTILTPSNLLHHLVWTAITVDSSGPFLATLPQRGPWFWVHSAFGYSYILFGMGLFIVFSRSATLFRRQALILLASSAIPLLGNALHLAGAIPVPGLDIGVFAFALSAGLLALGLFRYRMLDIVPVAQRVVLDHLQDGVIVLDPHGRIVDLNPAARQMLDLGPGEMVGQLVGEVVQPPEVLALCPAPDEGGPDSVAETLIALKKGQRWLRVSALPLMTQRGRAEGRILIFRDVTREQTAEQLRQDLTHITVHDLRNPLNVVEGALAVLADAGPQAVDASVRGYLHLAQSGCRRATDLVTAILEVSQLESGRMPLNRKPLDVAGLVSDVCQGMGLLAAQRRLTLAVELTEDAPPIRADVTLLRRVLENLVGNAIKFTQPGGMVTAAARMEEAGLHFPFVERVRRAASACWVLELHPRPGDLPAEWAAEVLPRADVVALTGTSLINHTFDDLIALCRPGAFVLLLGGSAPLTPLLFDRGVDAVSGTRVVDVPAALQSVGQGATFRQIAGRQLLTMMRDT
ncbi:MAG: histidine kinase N-terminal 7TM domain-containing protein [Anaerolineae bacterium]